MTAMEVYRIAKLTITGVELALIWLPWLVRIGFCHSKPGFNSIETDPEKHDELFGDCGCWMDQIKWILMRQPALALEQLRSYVFRMTE